VTVFCFVRHGAYDLLNHALGGRADHSLNDAGRAQAEAVARGLAGRTIAAVVSSPVQRARETAAPIGALLATTVQFDPASISAIGQARTSMR
jgi:broad specificity phosphatase PhoE